MKTNKIESRSLVENTLVMTKMEELVKSMQEMFKKGKTNEDSDKYLFYSPKYNPKVKVSEWFLPLEAEPKDNNPYSPPGGDYFLSTYKRLGTEGDTELESETHAMLRQVCCAQRPNSSRHKPLVHLDTDALLRKETSTVPSDRNLFDQKDFTTTYGYDYRYPYPYKKTRTSRLDLVKKPEKGYKMVSIFSPSKICETMFLDDKFYNSERNELCLKRSPNATRLR